jgi:hypothetical protein
VCPGCGAADEASARFCRDCGLPLVHAAGVLDAGRPLTKARERARKVLPHYSEGPLTRVATARHQAEAEMLEGLLLEEGIPSLIRRTGGFDVPDFLASGPRDILVPASGAELAREILGTGEPAAGRPTASAADGPPAWVKALAVALAVGLLALIAAGVFGAVF